MPRGRLNENARCAHRVRHAQRQHRDSQWQKPASSESRALSAETLMKCVLIWRARPVGDIRYPCYPSRIAHVNASARYTR